MELDGRIYFQDENPLQQVTKFSKDNVKIFKINGALGVPGMIVV